MLDLATHPGDAVIDAPVEWLPVPIVRQRQQLVPVQDLVRMAREGLQQVEFHAGKGLLATEGVVSIPLMGYAAPVLCVNSAFFEFVDDAGCIRLAADLEHDACYEVILTTANGLYRYRLGDRVRVIGSAGRTPLLSFLGRAGVVSDLCGEKLAEAFVAGCLRDFGGFAMLAPSREPRPHYKLYVDKVKEINGSDKKPVLFNLKEDTEEKNDLSEKFPEKVKEMKVLAEKILKDIKENSLPMGGPELKKGKEKKAAWLDL